MLNWVNPMRQLCKRGDLKQVEADWNMIKNQRLYKAA
jgi:hypothetical protein